MANSEDKKLAIDVIARIDKLEKAMARASGVVDRRSGEMEARTKRLYKNIESGMTGAVEKANSVLEKLGAGGLIGGGIAGMAAAIREVSASVAEVGREAQKAGVSSQVWQRWTYVAKGAGANIDGVTDALKELNIRGDEFAKTGQGSAADAFKTLGFTAQDVARKLQDPDALLDDIAAKLRSLPAASRTRALDELFGGTGAEQMAKVFSLSVDQLKKMRTEAAVFSDDQIKAASEIDRKFSQLWRNWEVYAKAAILASAEYGDKTFSTLSWLKGDSVIEGYKRRATDPAEQLKALEQQRAALQRQLAAASSPDNLSVMKGYEIKTLQSQIAALDKEIEDAKGGSEEYRKALKDLGDTYKEVTLGAEASAAATANFKTALADLKKFVPELKAELDSLAQTDAIEQAYQKTVQNAQSMGEVMRATQIEQRGLSVARYGNVTNMQDLLGASEGTDRGRGYNETLGYGAFTGGPQNLTGMTLNQVRDLQRRMLADPRNTFNSSAVGRYQITGRTLDGLMRQLHLNGSEYFDSEMQDRLSQELLRQTGPNPTRLRSQWTSLRGVDDQTIMRAYNGSANSMPAVDQSVTDADKKNKAAKKSYDDIVLSAREFIATQAAEQAGIGKTAIEAAKLRYEQQLLNDAQKAGLALTPDQTSHLTSLADQMAEAEVRTKSLTKSQQDAQKASEQFGAAAGGVMKGFISDLAHGKSGSEAFRNALSTLADKMLDSSLNTLFGGGDVKGGGVFGSLFSKLFSGSSGIASAGGSDGAGSTIASGIGKMIGKFFGFADGGYTGPGGKNTPAGIVHAGEVVWSQRDVARAGGVGVVNAMRLGRRGYADGGIVAPALVRAPSAPALLPRAASTGAAANNNPGVLQVHISGASGDEHVRMIAKQGVQEGLQSYNKHLERTGFGQLQAQYNQRKA